MKILGLAVAVALAFVPILANAHGPTRQKVTITQEVNASPEDVWAHIGNFQDMSWHPAAFKTDGSNGNEIDATRLITLAEEGGPTIAEILYKYSDTEKKRSYSYRITSVKVETLPVTNYSSHLTVKPADDGKSLVEWRGAFYRGYPNNDPPEHLNDEAAIKAVTGIYEMGLKAVAEHFAAGN